MAKKKKPKKKNEMGFEINGKVYFYEYKNGKKKKDQIDSKLVLESLIYCFAEGMFLLEKDGKWK